MQKMRSPLAALVLSISALAVPTHRGLVIAADPKGDEARDAALREGMKLLFAHAMETALKEFYEKAIRVLELNDPLEKGIYDTVLGSESRGTLVVKHSTVSITLMRPVHNQEFQKTLRDLGGNLDVVLTKVWTKSVKSETATVAIVEEVEGGVDIEQSTFVYDSKQGWRTLGTSVSLHRRQAK